RAGQGGGVLALVAEELLCGFERLPLQELQARLVRGDGRVLELERRVEHSGVALRLRRADRGRRLLAAAAARRQHRGRAAQEGRAGEPDEVAARWGDAGLGGGLGHAAGGYWRLVRVFGDAHVEGSLGGASCACARGGAERVLWLHVHR